MTADLKQKTEDEIKKLPVVVQALWHAAHGAWETAHKLVQDDPSTECAWVHAYLHRVEGDIGNARYWYHQAGKKPATNLSLDDELEQLMTSLNG